MKRVTTNHNSTAYLVSGFRILVGLLFIISGLVKANDPLGLSYKMQEFFEVWNSALSTSHLFIAKPLIQFFEYLHEHSLLLSIVMIGLEIMAGIALLLGWQKKWVLRLLVVLIVFFTFLTGYAFYSGKFKNCGCFGDCLPISPLTSFIKDIVLLVLILLLWALQKYIQPFATKLFRNVTLIIFLLLTIGFQWYVLTYLPVADCLPFKKGNNISQQMQLPPGARPDSFAIRFIYKKEGKNYEFLPTTFPADLGSYTFVDRIDKLITKGNAEPAIKGFSLMGTSDADSTQQVLELPNALLLFHLKNPSSDTWKDDFSEIYQWAAEHHVPIFVSTSTKSKTAQIVAGTPFQDIPIFTSDVTVIRTASRTPLTLYFLNKGTVVNKWSNASFEKALHYLKSKPVP